MSDLTHLSNEDLKTYYTLYKNAISKNRRAEDIKRNGYSTKYLMHLVRLLNQCEEILSTGTLDLERNREQLKAIRDGRWTVEQGEQYFYDKEKALDLLYTTSELRYSPDEEAIKQLLLGILNEYYGSLRECIENPGLDRSVLMKLKTVLDSWVP